MCCEDDLFGTAATVRLVAERIPNAEVAIYPTGGHIWLGHDEDLAERLASFIRGDQRAILRDETSTIHRDGSGRPGALRLPG